MSSEVKEEKKEVVDRITTDEVACILTSIETCVLNAIDALSLNNTLKSEVFCMLTYIMLRRAAEGAGKTEEELLEECRENFECYFKYEKDTLQ